MEALLLISLFVILCSVCVLIAKACTKNQTKISFREALDLSDLPIVTFYNNDTKLNFLLDTGSNASFINEEVLPNIEHEKTEVQKNVISALGNTDTPIARVPLKYRDVNFLVDCNIMDLREAFRLIKSETGVTIHGILGTDVLRAYRYIIDFNECIAYCK